MMNNLPGGNGMPPVLGHHGRRHDNYHYPPQHMPQHFAYPYPPPPPPPPPQYYAAPHAPHYPQWYQNPYPQHYMQPQMPQHRHYQPQSPMIVSSHPHAQPLPQMPRHQHTPQPIPPPQPSATPQAQPEQPPTPSTSTQNAVSPSTTPTTASINTSTPPAQALKELPPSTTQPLQPSERMPFYPPLPWYSVPEADFPSRIPRRRRKRKTMALLELPLRESPDPVAPAEATPTLPPQSAVETEPSSVADSEILSTDPATPASSNPPLAPSAPIETPQADQTQKKPPARAVVPAIPITPALPRVTSPNQKKTPVTIDSSESITTDVASKPADTAGQETETAVQADSKPQDPAPAPKPPTSWAALLRSKASASNGANNASSSSSAPNGLGGARAGTLGETLRTYDVNHDNKFAFLEPRGLVNTGNMCYMNSILQVLVFCAPFYEFLDTIGKRAVHSFKSDTPLVEAMIMFMREYNIIDSASSVEQLRLRLKDTELEQYGDAFTPEFVYEVINRLPRFSSMRRGHQQDAEEFLGFLLEGLHDECVRVMKAGDDDVSTTSSQNTTAADGIETAPPSGDGWLEVGPKQKAAVTRSSGAIATESPITKIFGGNLRSEFRVPGNQTSVTLEPYQPLQLDIGDPKVFNITDALRGLTRSETIHGEFNTPKGPGTKATKQVFIETLPPVLILHLKRFQYDNTGGTQKIWKKIGYPLDLEIPKEVFPQSKRNQLTGRPGGLPKYRLIAVVYHHGKNASGGHYTVDVRRQDGREWIRIDDTLIRRLRAEDVAKEGGEEDPKVLAAALENHQRDMTATKNIYSAAGFDADSDDENADDGKGWSQVNGGSTSPSAVKDGASKKWSGVVNGATTQGTATPSTAGKQTPRENPKFSVKDNKVAYILFYQQVKA